MAKKRRIRVDEVEGLVRDALVARGEVIPQTEAEVALAEENLDLDTVELPPALRDPFACLASDPGSRGGRQGNVITLTDPADDDTGAAWLYG